MLFYDPLPPAIAEEPTALLDSRRFMHKHLIILAGPAGCGKTTIGKHVSKVFEIPYIEGDNFHPPANIDKMKNGVPVQDEDRWDWLVKLQLAASKQLNIGSPAVILSCSALKKKYRDVIRIAAYNNHQIHIHFLYLRASEQVLFQRVAARQGHFMGSSMVHSQFQSLEEPESEMDVHPIDASRSLTEVQQHVLDAVRSILGQNLNGSTSS